MPTEVHDFEYMQDFLRDGIRAGCSCGWESRNWSDDLIGAHDEWDNHCDQVFMEATGG